MIYLFATIVLYIDLYLPYTSSISAGVCLNDKLYNNTYDHKTPLWAPLPRQHIITIIVIILSWSFTGQTLYYQLGPRSPAVSVYGPRPPWADVSVYRVPTGNPE